MLTYNIIYDIPILAYYERMGKFGNETRYYLTESAYRAVFYRIHSRWGHQDVNKKSKIFINNNNNNVRNNVS